MRVYFVTTKTNETKLLNRFNRIIDTLHSAGVLVMSNLELENLSDFSSQDLEKIDQSGQALIEKVDALIIEGSRFLQESPYLIAVAIAHNKPILYLVEKGKQVDKNLSFLKQGKLITKMLELASYTDESLEKIILGFLSRIEQGQGKELPSIKFTLRITPRIERYLQWRVHNTKISKADYLRQIIEDIISADADYQKFIDK